MYVLKTKEFKKYAFSLICLWIIFSIIMFIYMTYQLNALNKTITLNNISIVGNIIKDYPELKDKIPSYFSRDLSNSELEVGKKIMQSYGYSEDLKLDNQPVYSGFYTNFRFRTILVYSIILLPLLLLYYIDLNKIFLRIRALYKSAEKIVDNKLTYNIPLETEGEIGILYNSFNLMAHRLKTTANSLKQEKNFLKNIISDISHQLKTPLSSLIMFNDILLSNDDMPLEKRKDFLTKSTSELKRMEWLTISLLKFARIEAGVIEFKQDKTKLIKPINNAINSLSVLSQKKSINIINNSSTDTYFIGDSEWLSEALINILKNCIEHTDENGTIDISSDETTILTSIVIRDTGSGISLHDLPNIFKRFYRSSNSTKTESIGIGLSLSKLIIESQNGTISVKSELGKGTEFTICFLKTIV